MQLRFVPLVLRTLGHTTFTGMFDYMGGQPLHAVLLRWLPSDLLCILLGTVDEYRSRRAFLARVQVHMHAE